MKATIVVGGQSREVTLYKRPLDRLKKSAASKARWITLTVNGHPVDVKVTSNAKWAGTADFIEYPWFELDGFAYWFALQYREKAEQVESVVTAEGTAVKFTTRVTSRGGDEEMRIALQRRTWYANRTKDQPDDLKADLKRLGLEAPTEAEVEEPQPEVKKGKKHKVEA